MMVYYSYLPALNMQKKILALAKQNLRRCSDT